MSIERVTTAFVAVMCNGRNLISARWTRRSPNTWARK